MGNRVIVTNDVTTWPWKVKSSRPRPQYAYSTISRKQLEMQMLFSNIRLACLGYYR